MSGRGCDGKGRVEDAPQEADGHLALGTFALLLHSLVECDLHATGKFDAHGLLDDISRTRLAALATDANEVLVTVAKILRVEWDVWNRPILDTLSRLLHLLPTLPLGLEPLLDGVLVGASEGGEDELTGIGVTLRGHHLVAATHDLDDLGEIREVEVRRDTLGIEVERKSDEIDVAGSFAIAEKAAFYSSATRENAKLSGCDSSACEEKS